MSEGGGRGGGGEEGGGEGGGGEKKGRGQRRGRRGIMRIGRWGGRGITKRTVK